ncbi:MAG: hypothetical protein HY589_03810 [Candidatus Omnitrophica bacterium]|nr:hypothetical protein [Candidatus Omnitrophota bacterium]
MKTIKRIIIISIAVVITVYFINLSLQKRFYQTISRETLIGTIRCAKSPDKNYDFYLFYFPATNGKRPDFIFMKLKGRDWLFEGEIIKWRRPLNFLGFKTAHRPIRIYDSAGNFCYLDVGANNYSPLHTLAFKIGKALPVVDASFISIVKQSFVPKTKFGIYATNTGYLTRRIR